MYALAEIGNEIDVLEEDIPDPLKLVIYRILQEAVHNAAMHGRCDSIRISLIKEDHAISLTVEDNGTGFDVEEALSKERMGLSGMEERAHLYGGEFVVDSAPGKGTVIRVLWPIQP